MTTIIVAIISTLGVVSTTLIQTIQANKKDSIESKLDNIRNALEKETLNRCKVDLINVMSRIKNGYLPTEEEKRVLIEEKEEYNKHGGNTYVDEMYNSLKKEGLI